MRKERKIRLINNFVYFIFYILFFSIFIFYLPVFIAFFKYSDTIEKYNDMQNNSIVVIYDDFHSKHGDLVLKTYKDSYSIFCKNKKIPILVLDYNKCDFDSFFYILRHLNKKKIYVNMSFSPDDDYGRDYVVYNIRKYLQKYNNTKFFIASGNNGYFLDTSVWNTINNSTNIKSIIKAQSSKYQYKYVYNTLISSKIFYTLFGDILDLNIDEKIKNELEKNNIFNKDTYKTILSFAYSSQLENIKNVFVVSSLDAFDVPAINKKEKTVKKDQIGLKYALSLYDQIKDKKSSFLDCQIDGLMKNKYRDIGCFYISTPKYFVPNIGTSLSSPIFMSRYICSKEK